VNETHHELQKKLNAVQNAINEAVESPKIILQKNKISKTVDNYCKLGADLD